MSIAWKNNALGSEVVPQKGIEAFVVPDNAQDLIFTARVAEQVERYDEMALCMRKLVKLNPELGEDERNLLSVAYKNLVSSRRSAWRIATSIVSNEDQNLDENTTAILNQMNEQFEKELGAVCEDLIQLLDNYLIQAPGSENKIFYLKMKGDYHRYWAEVCSGDSQKTAALQAYQEAMDTAKKTLPPSNAIRLGLALNLSVFHYEILKEHDAGLNLAVSAHHDATSEGELDADAQQIVILLEDNIKLWKENA